MADVRKLRRYSSTKSFELTAASRGIAPGSASALALVRALGRLRSAERLPLEGDALVEFWGSETCWAHRFTESLWLYYKVVPNDPDEAIVLRAIHDYVHQQ